MKAIKKRITCIFLCAVFPLIIISPLGAQQDVPREVIKAAQEGLPFFLERISQEVVMKKTSSTMPLTPDPTAPSAKKIYGFENDDPLDKAYLGEPFKFYVLTSDTILNYSKDSNLVSLLSETDQWYFPVMIGGNAKSVLIVDKMQGSWKAVALGKRGLARGLGRIQQNWPRAKGYTPLLMASYDAYKYLFTVPQYNSKNLTIVSFQTEAESNDYSKLADSENVIGFLKGKIKKRAGF